MQRIRKRNIYVNLRMINTHATELVLHSQGFFHYFQQSYHMLDNSSGHKAELNILNILRLNLNSPRRITSIEVDGPDLDAFESTTCAQLRARELCKIAGLFPFRQTLLSLSWLENQDTAMLHENLNAAHHLSSSLIHTNHRTPGGFWQIHRMDFSRESFSYSNGWHADETYDLEVLAVAEQQYLQTCPDPAHGNFLSFCRRTRQGCFEIAYSRLCTDEFRKPMTMEKMDKCSWVGVGKGTWWNSVQ